MTRRRKMVMFVGGLLLLCGAGLAWLRRPAPVVVPVFSVRDLGAFPLNQITGTDADLPRDVLALDGKRVSVLGEIWAARDEPLESFELTYSVPSGWPHPPPQVQTFVDAHAAANARLRYDPNPVLATGTLHVGVEHANGKLSSVFRMDVERFEPWPTVDPSLWARVSACDLTAICLMTTATVGWHWSVRRRRLRYSVTPLGPPPPPRCPCCGYDVRAKRRGERCPECGALLMWHLFVP